MQYLQWLREQVTVGEIVLLWDVFSAHRDKKVKAYAVELRIRLIFIPPGMIDVYQPLDR
jgi:transposase